MKKTLNLKRSRILSCTYDNEKLREMVDKIKFYGQLYGKNDRRQMILADLTEGGSRGYTQ